ncbi:MAG: ASKHA domain-containing protein, partial [Actinomycetota bacterium]|nr:ASKHA domain-containing protein [Actinomycetota bacterium]
MAARVPVTFVPADATVWAAVGSTVLSAARSAGVIIAAPCGGRGVCGSCGVIVVDGALEPPDDIERSGLSSAPSNIRLACRARISSAVVLRPVVSQAYSSSQTDHASGQALVAGIDLGTTTVSAVIVGRDSGMELGRGTVANIQQSRGADVLSRVSAAMGGAGSELANDASNSVIAALMSACGNAGSCIDDIDRVVLAGNTAMHALLIGAEVSTLASAPFSLPRGLELPLSGPLRDALPDVEIEFVMPNASFVGGDSAAGLLAAGMIGAQSPEILVDIGTNAEILAVTSLGVTVASAPAGPAFEGFGISSGGPWGQGAIEQVGAKGDDLRIVVAGGGEPEWLCGSGLLGAIATLRRAGHINADGLMVSAGPWSDRFTHVG